MDDGGYLGLASAVLGPPKSEPGQRQEILTEDTVTGRVP